MHPLTLGVVISSFGSTVPLRRTLDSLRAAVLPPSLKGVWVVENGPARGAESLCREIDCGVPLRCLRREGAGLSGARNLGFAHADVDVVIFFDNDLRFAPQTLAAYDRAVQAHGTDYFYGGPVSPEYVTPPEAHLVPFLPFSARGFSLGETDEVIDEPAFLGGNHALPKAAIPEGDPYDSVAATGAAGGGVGEESRLQERLLAQGIRGFYVAEAKVWHYVPPENCTLRWLLRRYFRHGYTDGLADEPLRKSQAKLFGYPRRSWRKLISLSFRALASRLSGEEPLTLTEKRIDLHRHRGYMAGRRDAAR